MQTVARANGSGEERCFREPPGGVLSEDRRMDWGRGGRMEIELGRSLFCRPFAYPGR